MPGPGTGPRPGGWETTALEKRRYPSHTKQSMHWMVRFRIWRAQALDKKWGKWVWNPNTILRISRTLGDKSGATADCVSRDKIKNKGKGIPTKQRRCIRTAELNLQSFLTTALDGDERSTSGTQSGSGRFGGEKISCPCREANSAYANIPTTLSCLYIFNKTGNVRIT